MSKIQSTKNYRLFKNARHSENRQLSSHKHKKLLASMKEYGFLKCFPIVCVRDKDGNLVVKDGQHRLLFAETLNLPVHWVEETVNFDVAKVNSAAKPWVVRDYAEKFAANGKKSYIEGLEFADTHKLSISTAFAMLAGSTSFTNVADQFYDGAFQVKDREWANAVAGIYVPMVAMSAAIKNSRFIEACMACCRVPGIDPKRMISGAERCREKLVPYSTRDAYLDMLEAVYNFGRSKLVGLKALAVMAMRDRNVGKKKTQEPPRQDESAA